MSEIVGGEADDPLDLADEVENAKAQEFVGLLIVTLTMSEANRRMVVAALRQYEKPH